MLDELKSSIQNYLLIVDLTINKLDHSNCSLFESNTPLMGFFHLGIVFTDGTNRRT
jgi:hypothetical protein